MWCHNDKNNFMSSNEGQLNEHTLAGQLIINVIKYNNLKFNEARAGQPRSRFFIPTGQYRYFSYAKLKKRFLSFEY